MPDLPFIQFFPADWLQDTRVLSLSAKGAWIDLLCAMWTARERGRLRMRLSAYGRLIGTTDERTAQILAELRDLGVAEGEVCPDGTIVMWCRRMVRQAGDLEAQAEQRKAKAVHAARSRWKKDGSHPASPAGMPGASAEHANPDARSQSTERRQETASLPSAPGGRDSAPAREEAGRGDTSPGSATGAGRDAGITWSAAGFGGISEGDLAAWAEAFPALELRSQVARAHQWLLANPTKRKRSIRRFLVNWFARSQERGGDRTAASGGAARPAGGRHRDGYGENLTID